MLTVEASAVLAHEHLKAFNFPFLVVCVCDVCMRVLVLAHSCRDRDNFRSWFSPSTVG